MNTIWHKLSDQYLVALRAYLAEDTGTDLSSAINLGRKALRLGASVPDLALIHEDALMALISPALATEGCVEMIRQAGFFFRQTLAPFVKIPNSVPRVKAGKLQVSSADLLKLKKQLQRETKKCQAAESKTQESRRQYDLLLTASKNMQKQLRHLSHQILRAQEEERKRISRELHDEISQILTGINVKLAVLKIEVTANKGSVTRKIGNAQRLVEKSVATVHRFARELRPAMLDDLGLIPTLTIYMKEIRQRSGLHIRFSATKTETMEKLDSSKRTVLYRIVQEALTNVTKHAQASRVKLCLQSDLDDIFLELSDNGKSFSVSRVLANKRCKHLGLIGMRERAEMVGGSFEIESTPGKGTTIRVRIPLRNGKGNKNKKKPLCPKKMEVSCKK